MRQFEQWMEQAVQSPLKDPTAMVLATLDAQSNLAQRIVLLKGLSQEGFVFYTNYAGAKGQAIAANTQVSLLFPWNALDRQIIIRGSAAKVERSDSEAYFASRPRESQIAAWASAQSEAIENRSVLLTQAEAISERFKGQEIPAPNHWGGYRVSPNRIEFWQGAQHRLHDRFVYTKSTNNSWTIQQLQP